MEEYQEAMKIANAGKQQKLKMEMLHSVRERVFYLNTLVHHASSPCWLVYTLSAHTCLITISILN